MYLLNNNKFALIFNSAGVGTAALKIFPSFALQTRCQIIAGGLVQWLKVSAWKVGDRGFRLSL